MTARGAVLVIVPCRDEERVIARKLANLARLEWPAAERAHRVVVVDDHSTDRTRAIATELGARLFPPGAPAELLVVANAGPPGKPHAIRRGLAELAPGFALVLLTDADVVAEPRALALLVEAFEHEAERAMTCGRQSFVRALHDDGSSAGLADARTAYDRWTARVRRFESKRGALFSVHGQWLAWRAELALLPDPRFAADDLDLAFQVRARASAPRAIRLVDGAVFHEARPKPGSAAARAQALRRARAWFQIISVPRSPPRGALESAQRLFYRHAPAMASRLTLLVPIATILGLGWGLGRVYGLGAFFLWLLVFTSGPGWRWARLMALIAEARRAEREAPLAPSWEPPRA
ncbi:MAG: glycosyltransferase family 2 protein [Planctomycetes bacterium]|nr:glycosyltransferase family 2 protein [Planctomycetota bacterium]